MNELTWNSLFLNILKWVKNVIHQLGLYLYDNLNDLLIERKFLFVLFSCYYVLCQFSLTN